MHKHRAVTLLFAVAGLIAAGCGSSDDGDASGTTVPAPATSAPAGPTTTAQAGSDPAMVAKAKAAVFQQADFPAGWQPQPEDEGLDIEMTWEELTRCLGLDPTASRAGMATSPTFLRGLATQTRSTVEYTSESSMGAIGTALAGPNFQQCAKDAFAADVKRSAPEGGVPGPVEIVPLDVPPAGTKTFAYRITVTINLQELKVPLFQDFLIVFDGGAVIRMLYLNPGSEFPKDLQRTLVEKIVARA